MFRLLAYDSWVDNEILYQNWEMYKVNENKSEQQPKVIKDLLGNQPAELVQRTSKIEISGIIDSYPNLSS